MNIEQWLLEKKRMEALERRNKHLHRKNQRVAQSHK
jgi:hypothetical protein